MAVSDLHCPKCGSEHVQRLSVIHAAGTSQINGAMAGDVNGHFAGGITTAKTTSSLAKMAAPPTKAGLGCFIFATLLFVALGFAWSWFWLGAILFACGIYGAFAKDKEFPALHAEWQRTFMCHRCGERFPWGQ